MNKWVCTVMKQIYSKDELSESYVCDDNSKSKFKQIDKQRMGLLNEALQIKYRIPAHEINNVWKKMKAVAGRVCIETRKKLKSTEKNGNKNTEESEIESQF